MKRTLAVTILLSLILSLVSCKEERSADALMRELCEAYGCGAVVYSPSVPEGERGYTNEDFLSSLYSTVPSGVEDYAVALLCSLESHFEVGILVCKTAYDALEASRVCLERIELVRVICAKDAAAGDGAFVLRYGNTVAYAIAEDSESVRRILDALLG
ncbi:MAG: hypothetical protein IJY65_05225 [Clostridia bacterium]|nr:hypothetical protein [Clostridia bacterium]